MDSITWLKVMAFFILAMGMWGIGYFTGRYDR